MGGVRNNSIIWDAPGSTSISSPGQVNSLLMDRMVKFAGAAPMFCTSNTFRIADFTGQNPKSTESGKVILGRLPMARMGTMNFSRSVQHTRSHA